MHIILNHSSMVPIYEQLMEQIKTGIIESALAEGEALPSVRKLAGELRISALTVKKAYDKLEEAGFVTTVHGKGTFVAASDKQLALEARRRAVEEEFEKASAEVKKFFGNVAQVRELAQTKTDIVNSVTKGQFLKQYEVIVNREREQKLLPQSMKDFTKKLVEKMDIKQIGE